MVASLLNVVGAVLADFLPGHYAVVCGELPNCDYKPSKQTVKQHYNYVLLSKLIQLV